MSLVIIGTRDDRQALTWYKLGQSLGFKSYFLDVIDCGREWFFEIDGSDCNEKKRIITSLGENEVFYFSDPSLRWYIRAPLISSLESQLQIRLIHECLHRNCYDIGTYFYNGLEFQPSGCKPLQHANCIFGKLPATFLTTNIKPFIQNKNEYIVKSNSGVRSVVTDLSDNRIEMSITQDLDCPVQVQNRLNSKGIKIHFYKSKKKNWICHATSIIHSKIDYRYDDSPKFHIINDCTEFLTYADIIYEQYAARFFDIDLIDENGEIFFLEVNFSPVPTYYEERVGPYEFGYSRQILEDWMTE